MMKNLKFVLLFLALFNNWSCDSIDDLSPMKEISANWSDGKTAIRLSSDHHSLSKLNDLLTEYNGIDARVKNSELSWDNALAIPSADSSITVISLELSPQAFTGSLVNFVSVIEEDSIIDMFIQEFEPSEEYVKSLVSAKKNLSKKEFLSGFQGNLVLKNFDGSFRNRFVIDTYSTSKNKRTTGDDPIVLEEVIITAEKDGGTYEGSGDGGYGWGGGFSGGYGGSGVGSTTGNQNGSGSSSGGSSSGSIYTPISVDDTELNPDAISIATYLKPLKDGDVVVQPYDGMQAVDKNGVIYTYDSEVGAWLMPDLMNFELTLDGPVPSYHILSTITVIALVQPIPIGYIIAGGIIIYIFVYEASQVNTEDIDISIKDHCAEMFVLCSGRFGSKNMDCTTCQQFCNFQGYWDFERCPLRD